MQMFHRFLMTGLLLLIGLSYASAEEMLYPLHSIRAADGSLYIVDLKMHGVWVSKEGVLKKYYEGSPKFRTPLNTPRCLAFDKDGKLLCGDTSTREVYRFDEPGKPTPLTKGGIGMPMAIAVDAEGTIFVADLELHRIFKVPHAGGAAVEFVAISAPRGLAFDAEGNLIVLSTTKNQVYSVSKEGKATVLVEGRPFNFPHNVAVGPDKTLYVTDGYEKSVWKIGLDHKPVKLVSGAPFDNPVGLSLSGEKLLVTDPRANAVLEVDFNGMLTKLNVGK